MINVDEFELFHYNTRLKNIVVKYFKKTGENGAIWVYVKLNIIDNEYKIDFTRIRDEDTKCYEDKIVKDTTGNKEDDIIFIENALKFIEENGYASKVRKRYEKVK